jgi:integrase
MLAVVTRSAWDNFVEACDSPKTLDNYQKYLRQFMNHYGIGPDTSKLKFKESIPIIQEHCQEILKESPEDLTNRIIDYLVYCSKQGLVKGYITGIKSALKLFLSMNDVILNWDKINKFNKGSDSIHEYEPYTEEQIEKMLPYCNQRTRIVITMMWSSGIRIGGFEGLKVKHLKEIDTPKGKIYRITIYEGAGKDQYITFCSHECYILIRNYLNYRQIHGEKINGESPLIRDTARDDLVRERVKAVTKGSITSSVHRMLKKSGVRVVNEGDIMTRHENALNHSFRQAFINACVKAGMQFEHREKLSGHRLQRNDENYVRVQKELLEKYLSIMNELTIDKSFILKKQVEQLEEERNEIEVLKLKHKEEMNLVLKELNSLKESIKPISGLVELMNNKKEGKTLEDNIKELLTRIQNNSE